MQETTFNSTCNESEEPLFSSISSWLNHIYGSSKIHPELIDCEIDQFKKIDSIIRLQDDLGYNFTNFELLITAVTHSTFSYEFKKHLPKHNERLEFLGDSIINLMVGKKLFEQYPQAHEGELSRLRGALVNEVILAKLAQELCLGQNLFLGRGEFKNNGHQKSSILSDALESLVAAVYLDSEENIKKVETCFDKIVEKYSIRENVDYYSMNILETFDSKTKLQELVMALYQTHPHYQSTSIENGFKVEVWINNKKLAEKIGHSKKKLEKELAQKVIEEKLYLK